MKRNFKKSLAVMLCLVMMVASVPLSGFIGLELPDWSLDFSGMLTSFAADVSDDSGSCGDNVTYTFDAATGTLTISGEGDMYDYNSNDNLSPWEEYNVACSIKEVFIESGVTSIGNYAFYGCASLTSITIPDSVTSIGNYAFRYCASLTSITIPDLVTSIGSYAFYNCTSLTSITISDSVTSIGWDAFRYCAIETAGPIGGGYDYEFGWTDSIPSYAFYYCTSLTSIIIPDSVTSIESYAFYNCTSLTSITIPDSVTSIESVAFSGCTSLTSITIPDSVTSIESGAFSYCTSLTSITIPDSVTSIESWAFGSCTSLTNITIPDSVTSIGESAFSSTGWYNNQDDGVLYLDNWVICYKGDYTEAIDITLKDGTVGIANQAFYGCLKLTSITIPDSVTSIGGSAFSRCASLTSIIIPDSVTSIGSSAFFDCTSLTILTIPDSVTSIGDRAFAWCSSLTSIAIPDSVTSIGGEAFYKTAWYNSQDDGVLYLNNWVIECVDSKISDVIINEGTVGIADYAFNDCTSLTNIIIPDSVTSIGSYAFDDCSSLTSITIPDSITIIESNVFSGCTSLTSITIPDSVTSIGSWAFSCASFTIISIPDSVTSIESGAFSYCTSLTSIIIPDSVASIESEAFSYCTSLTSIIIPDSVTSIESYAFSYCTSLETVYYTGSEEQWNAISISSNNNDCLTDATIIYNYEVETDPCEDGHSYTSTITKAATCGATGTKTYTCSVCGDSYSKTIAATGNHSYGSWVTTTAATPVSTGTQTRTCSVCGDKDTQTIAKLTVGTVSKITVENGSTWLQISWTAAANATGYQIFVDGTKVATLYDGETTYKISSLSGATDYDIKICAFSKVGGTTFGGYSSTYTFTTNPFKASFSSYSCTETAIRVNWNAVAGADGYRIYQLIDGKWVSLATVSASTLTYRVSGLESGEEYSFKVKAYTRDTDGVAQFGVASNEYTAKTKSTQVQMTTYTNTTSAIRINWEVVDDADGYRVYQYVNGSWTSIATIQSGSTTTYRISGLDDGTIYKFKVKAFIRNSSGTAVWQEASDTFTTMTDLATAKITSSSKTSTAVRINWNEVDGATGYKVYMLVNGTWKVIDTIYDGEITTYRIDGLSSGTTYQFKIKAFSKDISPVVWGGTSSIYKVTTK